jgi:uncharacterized protein (DUF3820 family)
MMEIDEETIKLIEDADRMRMPFGRFGPEQFPPMGVPICDLPYEYLSWFQKKGFPKGRLGEVMTFVYGLKADGADALFDPLRAARGGRTPLRKERQRKWEF